MNLKKLSRMLCLTMSSVWISFSVAAADSFCDIPESLPTEKKQDALFLQAMQQADYIFRGRLFTYYNEKCDGDICAYSGLVFKKLEDIENNTNAYVETRWEEDCSQVWLFPTEWRKNKDKIIFSIKNEYLLLGKETDDGMVIFGAREGIKLKTLMMQYELNRFGGK